MFKFYKKMIFNSFMEKRRCNGEKLDFDSSHRDFLWHWIKIKDNLVWGTILSLFIVLSSMGLFDISLTSFSILTMVATIFIWGICVQALTSYIFRRYFTPPDKMNEKTLHEEYIKNLRKPE